MKSCRDHGLVILPLAKVATKSSIAGIHYKHHWVGIVIIAGLAYKVVCCQPFDITKGFIVLRETFEFDAFASEI